MEQIVRQLIKAIQIYSNKVPRVTNGSAQRGGIVLYRFIYKIGGESR